MILNLFLHFLHAIFLFVRRGGVDGLVAHDSAGDEEDEDNMSRSWQGR